jgi:type II secretory pathway pseudopilin PulG
MRRALGRRLAWGRGEAGFTLIELLVASTMTVVVMGAIGSLVISAMREQPKISKGANDISTARWVLERLTREIRQGVVVNRASGSSVSFQTYVRRTSCGGTGTPASTTPAIKCEVTYTCTTTSCTRTEAAPGVYTGTATTIFNGIDRSEVFCYVPSTNADPTTCGPPTAKPGETTYVGVTVHLPSPTNPSSGGGITISDGADLRNATLTN